MSNSVTNHRGERPARVPAGLAAMAAVIAGGLVGSGMRAAALLRWPAAPGAFPVSTLAINLAGAFLLGLFLARRQRSVAGPRSVQFWAIGVLGSFTTFALFSLEIFELLDGGHAAVGLAHAAASTLGGVALAILGARLGEVGQ